MVVFKVFASIFILALAVVGFLAVGEHQVRVTKNEAETLGLQVRDMLIDLGRVAPVEKDSLFLNPQAEIPRGVHLFKRETNNIVDVNKKTICHMITDWWWIKIGSDESQLSFSYGISYVAKDCANDLESKFPARPVYLGGRPEDQVKYLKEIKGYLQFYLEMYATIKSVAA